MLGSDSSDMDIIKSTNTSSQQQINSNNQDLLDLLGGLDVSPPLPTVDTGLNLISENNNPAISFNNTNSNFLSSDLFSTTTTNGKYTLFYVNVCV